MYQRNKDMLYAFCYEHIDKKTNRHKPIVHGINALRILSIEDTEEEFNPIELNNINKSNTGFDYSTWHWALLPDRKWLKM